MEPMRPDEALHVAVTRCAIKGTEWEILNPDGDPLWTVERDSKVDDDDLTYPVIVHMGKGTGDPDIVLLKERNLV